jgi:hypothetical protein
MREKVCPSFWKSGLVTENDKIKTNKSSFFYISQQKAIALRSLRALKTADDQRIKTGVQIQLTLDYHHQNRWILSVKLYH